MLSAFESCIKHKFKNDISCWSRNTIVNKLKKQML